MAALPVKLRPTGQFHYGWVIIAILAVVANFWAVDFDVGRHHGAGVEGAAGRRRSIRMAAGVHRICAGGVLPGRFADIAVQRTVWGPAGGPQVDRRGRVVVRRQHGVDRIHHVGVAVLHRLQRDAGPHFVHLNGSPDGGGESVVPQAAGPGDRDNVGRRRSGRCGAGSGLFDAAGEFRLDGDVRCHRFGWRGERYWG